MSKKQENPLWASISKWMLRNFSTPGTIGLFFFLLFGFLFIEFFGGFFLPVLISVVIAYLLHSIVRLFERWRCPHLPSVLIVYTLFIGFFLYVILGLFPYLLKQLSSLVNELPRAFTKSQTWVVELMHHYPHIFTSSLVESILTFFKAQIGKTGQYILHISFVTISNVVQLILYLVLVPLLVFFFLKDGSVILAWLNRFMPKDKSLVVTVCSEVNEKIGCYVRGRVLEIIIVGVVSTIAFELLGLEYGVLMGALVGLSVVIPYIGAILVTFPLVIISLMEWGWSAQFIYFVIVFSAIITFDANLLVPLLFSETMDLHPVVIILSVVVFGGLWGFWGVFFAIPLATLCDAVLSAWPRSD